MNKWIPIVVLVVAMVFGSGAANSGHISNSFVEQKAVNSSTFFCIKEEDARTVLKAWVQGTDEDALNKLALLSTDGPFINLTNCGQGNGVVVPLELTAVYTRSSGEKFFIIKVRPLGFEFDIHLITNIPFVKVGTST